MNRVRPHRTAIGRNALIALLAALVLPACGGDHGDSGSDLGSTPFVFRSLNLRQQDLLGRPGWTLTSPEARYDIDSRIARADRPQGLIYRDGQPLYRLTATTGTVLNDGQVVLLEGAIRLEQLGSRPLLIQASRARWMPSRNLLELDRHPRAFDGSNRITARRARYLFDREQLQLVSQPTIEHWSLGINPLAVMPTGRPELQVAATWADWFPRDGRLQARGPLQGRRLPPGAAPTTQPQTLTASGLRGNTVEQRFTVLGPVHLLDPGQQLSLAAHQLQIDLHHQQVSTEIPNGVTAARPASAPEPTAAPQAALPDGNTGCLVLHGGDSLQAVRCQWNWATQVVMAQGDVQLRQRDHQQYSRGGLLVGTLVDGGRFRLTTPGGRVVSRFQAPAAPRRAAPAPRPAPEPIRL